MKLESLLGVGIEFSESYGGKIFLDGNRFGNVTRPRKYFELVSSNSFILAHENSKRY